MPELVTNASDAAVAAMSAPAEHIAPAAHEAGARLVARCVTRAASASSERAVDAMVRAVGVYGTSPQAALFGRRSKVAAHWAALVNATAALIEREAEPLAPPERIAASIVMAGLAAGELADASLASTLDAVVLAVDVTLRIERHLGTGHVRRGWDSAGTLGHLGAALCAGRVLGLEREAMLCALGIGATQAAGLGVMAGTSAAAYNGGKAAADGVEAAVLAHDGFTAPLDPLGGRRGFAALEAPGVDFAPLAQALQRCDGSALDALDTTANADMVRRIEAARAAPLGRFTAEL